jgi:hypothetical protein
MVFKNTSAISWWLALLVDENGVPGENHQPSANNLQTLSHNVVHLAMSGNRSHNLSVGRN